MTPPITHVLKHALELTGKLERRVALQYFVDAAKEITQADFSALAVLDLRGGTREFLIAGMTPDQAGRLDHPPLGFGVFAHIPTEGYLLINDLASFDDAAGVPDGHPHMYNFLGVPLRVHEQVYGRLYLSNKPGGFTDDDGTMMELLAQAAAIAVHNSKLFSESNRRAAWITASQTITQKLLEGSDEEEALELIAEQMRRTSRADASLIILPSVGDTWVCEIANGEHAHDMIGVEFPPDGRARTVIREGTGIVVDSMARQRSMRVPQMRLYGPALYAPMVSRGIGTGVIVLLRMPGGQEFDLADLAMAEYVARQAALALELAAARHAQDVAMQLDERARISRDLHDLAIQQLFASGMQITAVREDLASRPEIAAEGEDGPVLASLNHALSAIDESVRQIRQIVHSLRDPDAAVAVVERLRRETSNARQSLGFAPSFIITLNGKVLDPEMVDTVIDDVVGADVADDIVAVVREGLSNVARHAHAASVSLTIDVTDDMVKITVDDDGVGLAQRSSRRSGLSNLAARARRHRGTFALTRGPHGVGTRMEWTAEL